MDYSTMEAGPEMDALVAELVMGWHVATDKEGRTSWETADGHWAAGMGKYPEDDDEFLHTLDWHPSESILWALQVMEKLDNPSLSLMTPWGLWVCEGRGDTYYKATATTPMLAIGRAALMAQKEG